MKTLITALAVLTLSFTTVIAKEGTFTSVILTDPKNPLELQLGTHQWIKITNFTQNPTDDNDPPPMRAGVAVFKGGTGLWVLFASDPRTHDPHEDMFIAGPATIVVSPPMTDVTHGGATVFLTYERGSD